MIFVHRYNPTSPIITLVHTLLWIILKLFLVKLKQQQCLNQSYTSNQVVNSNESHHIKRPRYSNSQFATNTSCTKRILNCLFLSNSSLKKYWTDSDLRIILWVYLHKIPTCIKQIFTYFVTNKYYLLMPSKHKTFTLPHVFQMLHVLSLLHNNFFSR